MTLWVVGHGSFDQESTLVRVPEPKRVSTYTPPGTVLEKTVAWQILHEALPARSDLVYDAGTEMVNLKIDALNIVEVQEVHSIALPEGGATMLLVGTDIAAPARLCTEPDRCNQDTGHGCDGLLGSAGPLAGHADADIRLVTCFEAIHSDQDLHSITTTELPAEQEPAWLDSIAKVQELWVERIAQTAGDRSRQAELVEALEAVWEEDKVLLLQHPTVKKFLYEFHARGFLDDHGPYAFFCWVSTLAAPERELYADRATAGAEALWGVVTVLGLLGGQNEEDALTAWSRVPAGDRHRLLELDPLRIQDTDIRATTMRAQEWARTAPATHAPPPDTDSEVRFDMIRFEEDEEGGLPEWIKRDLEMKRRREDT